MGLVSGLSLANRSDSESFLVVYALFSQDGCQREGFWEVVGHAVSPFDLSRTLPVGGGLLVSCSLAGSPILTQLMQMVTMAPGQGGRFPSVLPLTGLRALRLQHTCFFPGARSVLCWSPHQCFAAFSQGQLGVSFCSCHPTTWSKLDTQWAPQKYPLAGLPQFCYKCQDVS